MGKKKWELVYLEHEAKRISELEFNKIVEEISEIAYMYIGQLPKDSFLDSFDDEINFLQRTGTDA